MADLSRSDIPALRASKLQAEKSLHLAELRVAQAEKALATASGPAEAARRVALGLARQELAQAEGAFEASGDALENALADAREAAGNDDPVEAQTDYRLREILAKLHHYRQRATYSAVGGLLNASPSYVRAWFRGSESPENCWVVSASSGEPTDYPAGRLHPMLKKSATVLGSAEELLAWLQSSPIPAR